MWVESGGGGAGMLKGDLRSGASVSLDLWGQNLAQNNGSGESSPGSQEGHSPMEIQCEP